MWRGEKTEFGCTIAFPQVYYLQQGGSLHFLCHIITEIVLGLQFCHLVSPWDSKLVISLCGRSVPQKTAKGSLKVSPVTVMITINYLFIAHWNPQTLSTYRIMFLSAVGADFPFLNCLLQLQRQLRQPSGDAGRSVPASPAPRLSHCLHSWQKQVFPLPGSTQTLRVILPFLQGASPARNPEAAPFLHALTWPKIEPEVWFPSLTLKSGQH